MKIILFRCDSSNLIGSGHVLRCRNLARKLKIQGARIFFICREYNSNLITTLEKEFEVLIINKDHINSRVEDKNKKHFSKNKLFQLNDSLETFKLIKKKGLIDIQWIIIDHYELDNEWETAIKVKLQDHKNLKLLAIDDLRNRDHNVDIILDQNY